MTEFQDIFPDDETLNFRDLAFKTLVEKRSNLYETDDDAIDIDDLIAIAEAEDEDDGQYDKDSEAEEESSEEQNQLVPYTAQENFGDISPIELNQLKDAFRKRCAEVEQLNLSFWKRSKSQVAFNETNLKTKDFESSSRQFLQCNEEESGVNTTKALSPRSSFKFPHHQIPSQPFPNNQSFNISGVPLFQNPQFHNFPQPPLVTGNGQMYNIRVREYCYDYFSVTANDVSQMMQSYNRTLPNVSRAIDYVPSNQTIPLIQQNGFNSTARDEQQNHNGNKKASETNESNVASPPKKSKNNKKKSKNDNDKPSKKASSKIENAQQDRSSRENVLKGNLKKTDTTRSDRKIAKDDQKITKDTQNDKDYKMSYSDCVKLSARPTLRSSKYIKDQNLMQVNSTEKKEFDKSLNDMDIDEEDAQVLMKKEQTSKNSKKKNKKKKSKPQKKNYLCIVDSDTSSEDLNFTLKKYLIESSRQEEDKNVNKKPNNLNPSENKISLKCMNKTDLPVIAEEEPVSKTNKKDLTNLEEKPSSSKIQKSTENDYKENNEQKTNKTSSKSKSVNTKKSSKNKKVLTLPTIAEDKPISPQISISTENQKKSKLESRNKIKNNKTDLIVAEEKATKIDNEKENNASNKKEDVKKKSSNAKSTKTKKNSENQSNKKVALLSSVVAENRISPQISDVPHIEKLSLQSHAESIEHKDDEKIVVICDTDYDTSYDDLEYFKEASRKFFENAKSASKS